MPASSMSNYAEAGPAGRYCGHSSARLALHIYSFVDVAPLLASAGYHVHRPLSSQLGPTAFFPSATMRNGQQSAVALRLIALMDALEIQKAIVGGFDWGARTAAIVAALWPERCKAIVLVSGYLIGSPAADQTPLPPKVPTRVLVPVLFRDRNGAARLREIPARFCEAHLADRLAEVGLRRRHVRSLCGFAQQPGPRRDRQSTITAGASAWPTASGNTTIWKSGWPNVRSSPFPQSPWRATPTAPSTRRAPRIAISSRAGMSTASSPVESGTICPQEAPRAFAQAVIEVDSF